jgi:metallo-beta-lactamase class B
MIRSLLFTLAVASCAAFNPILANSPIPTPNPAGKHQSTPIQHKIVHHDILPSWIQDYPPFRIAGNCYYVGSAELASYLITTPKGHILVNTGVAGSDTMIRRHVEALGFKFTDIKILLSSQAHFDHVGAMAAVKHATKAKLMVEAEDAAVLEDGGYSDFDFGGKGLLFEPVRVDRKLHDRETITLGGTTIQLLHHPGHTKGASSFLFTVKDDQRSWRVLIANIPSILDETKLPSMPGYKNVEKDYTYTLDTMPKIQFDIWLAAHAGQFQLEHKHHPGDAYRPIAFADRPGYDAEIKEMQEAFAKRKKESVK